MSSKTGRLLTCDRCGKQIFLNCTGEGEADGGYTHWNTFEKADGWMWVREVGDMCPRCWRDYNEILEAFKRRPPQEREDGEE